VAEFEFTCLRRDVAQRHLFSPLLPAAPPRFFPWDRCCRRARVEVFFSPARVRTSRLFPFPRRGLCSPCPFRGTMQCSFFFKAQSRAGATFGRSASRTLFFPTPLFLPYDPAGGAGQFFFLWRSFGLKALPSHLDGIYDGFFQFPSFFSLGRGGSGPFSFFLFLDRAGGTRPSLLLIAFISSRLIRRGRDWAHSASFRGARQVLDFLFLRAG